MAQGRNYSPMPYGQYWSFELLCYEYGSLIGQWISEKNSQYFLRDYNIIHFGNSLDCNVVNVVIICDLNEKILIQRGETTIIVIIVID